MAITKHIVLVPCVLYLLHISTICLSSRIPINIQNEFIVPQTIAKSPKAMSLIGVCENVTSWQESVNQTQTAARSNCASWDRQLIRLKDQDHLVCLIFEGATSGSWTDGITFYERSMYQPEISADITLVHYSNLALRFNSTCRCLVAVNPDTASPSICSAPLRFNPNKITHKKIIKEQKGLITEEAIRVGEPAPILPHALVNLGTYGGYQYIQETTVRTLSNAQKNCEDNGYHLATFLNMEHLRFVTSHASSVTGSWTGYSANISREIFKWGNGASIDPSIQFAELNTHLGLFFNKTTNPPRLQADINTGSRASICMYH